MRALGLVALVTACNGFNPPAEPTRDAHPISNAGTGSSYPRGSTVTLDGAGSFDPDGTIVAYQWSVTQHPTGSASLPVDASAATTTFVPDQFGTYRLELLVRDDAQNTDTSSVRIVATGAITDINAGPDGTVLWLGTAQLSGTVGTVPGKFATPSWTFVSRPPGSNASLAQANTLTPTFVADATGTYVIAFDARVGDEVREDTVTIEATGGGAPVGSGIAAYTYSSLTDRIYYVHDVGHAEVVQFDPLTAAQATLDVGAFAPRSIATDTNHQALAVGGPGKVALVSVSLVLLSSKNAPGCTAKEVTIPYSNHIDCFPADGTIEPISSVDMTTGQVTQVPCPLQFPDVAVTPNGWMYMVDSASSQFYLYDSSSTPPLQVIQHGSLAGIAPPVIAAGTNQPFAVTGNGLAINPDATLRFDLHVPVSAGAFSGLRYEIAVVSGSQLNVFGAEPGQPLKLRAMLPTVNGMSPTARLVAYNSDEHRLIIVAGTAAGDVAYTVPR